MKRFKRILALMLASVTVLTLFAGCAAKTSSDTASSNTAADDSWSKVETAGKFVLGLDASFPPMGYTENGEIIGFDIDVAKEVCSRLGIELVLQAINWDFKEQELNTGNIDCIWNGFTINDERKEQVLFTDPYMSNRQVLVVMADSDIKTKADLAGKKLALQAGSSAKDALTANEDVLNMISGKAAIEFEANTMALNDLDVGGSDVVLIDEIVAKYYITNKSKSYKILDDALAVEDYGVGFRKADVTLRDKIQETLNAMAKDGKLAEISTTWFGEDITTVGK